MGFRRGPGPLRRSEIISQQNLRILFIFSVCFFRFFLAFSCVFHLRPFLFFCVDFPRFFFSFIDTQRCRASSSCLLMRANFSSPIIKASLNPPLPSLPPPSLTFLLSFLFSRYFFLLPLFLSFKSPSKFISFVQVFLFLRREEKQRLVFRVSFSRFFSSPPFLPLKKKKKKK
jgi:hypothetical protein